MKKVVVFFLALSFVFCCAVAENTGDRLLEAEEVQQMFRGMLGQLAEADDVLMWDENGVSCCSVQEGGNVVMLSNDEEPGADADVLGVIIREGADLRNITAGMHTEEVIRMYPCDNPAMQGNEYTALLYMQSDYAAEGRIRMAYAARNAGENEGLYYSDCTFSDDGEYVYEFGVFYHTEGDIVTGIRYYRNTVPAAQFNLLLDELTDSLENGTYIPELSPADGDAVAPFDEEDLIFSVMNVPALTAEEAFILFGNADVDVWAEDTTGDYLRICQWEHVETVLLYTKDRQFVRLYSIRFTGSDMPGPRGIKTGDSAESVLRLFCHDEDNGILYGNVDVLPYGIRTQTDDADCISYAASLGERQATLSLTFYDDALSEILITID